MVYFFFLIKAIRSKAKIARFKSVSIENCQKGNISIQLCYDTIFSRLKNGCIKWNQEVVKCASYDSADAINGSFTKGCDKLVSILSSSGKAMDFPVKSLPELGQAVLDALQAQVYSPALLDGKPVNVSYALTFKFRLN